MNLFKILVDEKIPSKPRIVHFQPMTEVPSQSIFISTGFWRYNNRCYIIDMNFTLAPTNLKDKQTIYRLQLTDVLTRLRLL